MKLKLGLHNLKPQTPNKQLGGGQRAHMPTQESYLTNQVLSKEWEMGVRAYYWEFYQVCSLSLSLSLSGPGTLADGGGVLHFRESF